MRKQITSSSRTRLERVTFLLNLELARSQHQVQEKKELLRQRARELGYPG